MKLRLYPQRLKADLDTLGFAIDVFMIGLVIANLGLIIFDWLFQVSIVNRLLVSYTPQFHDFYLHTVHNDFLFYDLCFVAVYLSEFFIRWMAAIARHTYHRWFFYPFVHWYDLLGCIPVGSFRWLRVLRVISLLMRLQKRGIIDLSQTWLGQTYLKYYNIVVEEVSDRVVINVLSGAQREINSGSPLFQRIEQDVLAPREKALVHFLADRITAATQLTHDQYREPLARYLSHLTDEALTRTQAGQRLVAIPIAGPRALALLGDAVRETGTALVDQFVDDLSSPTNRVHLEQFIHDIIKASQGDAPQLNALLRETLLEILEQVKHQIAVQQWKASEQDATPSN